VSETGGKHLADRIRRGREAVARARARGSDCAAWEERLAQLEAEETASLTAGLLATRGWCLWRCDKLDGRVIAVANDEHVRDLRERVAVFTEAEMRELFKKPPAGHGLLKLVIEAKKLGGARVLRREFKEHGDGNES